MNYAHIISGMTWSYSRLKTYEDCPYKFFLKYIKHEPGERQFFADYGSFMHLIIQKYLTGELKKKELINYYLMNFKKEVLGSAPNKNIFQNYFYQGMGYLRNITPPPGEIIGVEKEVEYMVESHPFIGYIDCITSNNDEIEITDNKSRTLKPRSMRVKKTKTDRELDEYLKQLYLYSVAIEQEYHSVPSMLNFNCFRNQNFISEPFNHKDYNTAKSWALDTIKKIEEESDWNPDVDWFKCTYICDCYKSCEYYQLFNS